MRGDLKQLLRAALRRGLRPGSTAAFAAALLCVAAATALRLAIDLIAPEAVPFATFFPAVLVATLVGGVAAGIVATVLSMLVSWWAFMPPRYSWSLLTPETAVSLALFVLASALIIWVAAQYRKVVRQLDEEEKYRKVVVDELGHRVKNKLATIYAILRHELRGHDDIWHSVSGRLRALSVADDFLVRAEGKGVDLRQILEMEMEPYDSSRISLQGEALLLFAKVPTILALVFHELATNAAKYGALSAPGGRLTISWRPSGDDVLVEWVETGGPAVAAPTRRSFGSNLIERSLDAFGGSAKIEFAPAGVICRMRLPKPKAPAASEVSKAEVA
ncbi:MAG: HWE histidine kinase domain-containing protein [Pseudolabrys sp.]